MASNVIGDILNSALSLGTGIVSTLGNHRAMRRQFNYQKQLQDRQNQFYEHLSSTAHQREVADLHAAGLNPILSVTGGNGAASAMGAAGSVDAQNDIAQGIQSALAFRQQRNQDKATESQIDLNGSQSGLNRQNEITSKKQESLIGEQARNEAERYDNIVAERLKTLQDIENSKALTNAQVYQMIKGTDSMVHLNSAQAWRARHQALGFSDSWSDSSSSDAGGSVGVRGLSFGTETSHKKSNSRSSSRSRTY